MFILTVENTHNRDGDYVYEYDDINEAIHDYNKAAAYPRKITILIKEQEAIGFGEKYTDVHISEIKYILIELTKDI